MTIPISRKGDGLKRALFLCEDNFLASRYCEELFNSFVRGEGLNWQAVSRAILPVAARNHAGPMAAKAVDFLREIGAAPMNHRRLPLGATAFDFEMSHIVIVIAPRDRHGLISASWPRFATQCEFWTVNDSAQDEDFALNALLRQLTVSVREMLDQMLGRVPEPFTPWLSFPVGAGPSVKLGPQPPCGDRPSHVRAREQTFDSSSAPSSRSG